MDHLSILVQFGLTRQEATIYIELLSGGQMTGYEVAKRTGISRSNVYTSLAGLVEKGAAYLLEGDPMYYTPVPLEEFLANHIRQLTTLKSTLLSSISYPSHEIEGYATIKGSRHIIDQLKNLVLQANYRIYASASADILNLITPELDAAVARGLKIVIISNSSFELPGAQIYHSELPASQIRIIVDSSFALTGDIVPDNENCTCLFSGKQNLADLIKDALKNEIRLIALSRMDS